MLRHAPGDQVGQAEVCMATGERVQEKVRAFARFQGFGQQRRRRGQGRPALLQLEQRFHAFEFRRVKTILGGQRQLVDHRFGQRD